MANLTKKIIALTGYKGFIGQHLLNECKKRKEKVLLIDGDVRDSAVWKDKKFDVLLHCAGASSHKFFKNADEAMATNTEGVINALEACKMNRARMVFFSSCGVYKQTSAKSYAEDAPVQPQNLYVQSKLKGEELCRSYAQQWGVPATILRLFNVYGANQNEHYIIPYLINCAVQGKEASIKHPASQRDFVYIDDVAKIIFSLLDVKDPVLTINIGTGRAHSILEVIAIIEEITKKKINYKESAGDPDPHAFSSANIDRLRAILPKTVKFTPLKAGIKYILESVK